VLNAIAETAESNKEELLATQQIATHQEEFLTHMAGLVLFHMHRVLKKNPVLDDELKKPVPSYARILRILKDNRDKFTLDVFDELGKNAESMLNNEGEILPGDPALMDAIRKFLGFSKELEKEHLESGKILNNSRQREAGHIQLCMEGFEKQSSIFDESDTYDGLLGDMYTKKLISTISMVNWCSHCVDEPFVSMSMSKLSPQQANFKCPKCRRDMCVAGAYGLTPCIRELIFLKDGVIGGAAASLLNEKRIDFEHSRYAGDFEIDFIFKHRGEHIMLECKQHKYPSGDSSSAIRNNLTKDIEQLSRTRNAFHEQGTAINKSILLSNYWLDSTVETEIKHLKQTRRDLFTDDIVVMDCRSFQTYLGD